MGGRAECRQTTRGRSSVSIPGPIREAMASPGVVSPMRNAGGTRPDDPGLVLLVDDEPLLLRSLRRILARRGPPDRVRGDRRRRWSPSSPIPTSRSCVLDLFLGRASGLDLLDRVRRERPEVEVIVMTGHASIESAVGCIRRGAFDYLAKPFDDVYRVRTTVGKALERRRLLRRNRELEDELRGRAGLPELVGARAEDARAVPHDREPAPQREPRADPGRERHRQGARGAGDPLEQPARRRPVRARRLRRAAREHHRERAVRARARRLHRRARRAGPVPHGEPGNALPRRGGRDPAARAGQAAAGAPAQGGAPGGLAPPRCRSTSA